GSLLMCLASAATTVVVSLRGILMSIVKRVLRSTRVAMCVSFAPVRRSPSQCPGTARSSISAGRSRIETISRICPCPLRVVALGVTHPPRSTQLRRQLLFQHAAGLDEEAAIDRFVRYPHVLVGWELLLQSASRRSAAATIAARASAPRAIVARCTAPNDKAWGATPAPWHADQPGLHDRPDCRRCA